MKVKELKKVAKGNYVVFVNAKGKRVEYSNEGLNKCDVLDITVKKLRIFNPFTGETEEPYGMEICIKEEE